MSSARWLNRAAIGCPGCRWYGTLADEACPHCGKPIAAAFSYIDTDLGRRSRHLLYVNGLLKADRVVGERNPLTILHGHGTVAIELWFEIERADEACDLLERHGIPTPRSQMMLVDPEIGRCPACGQRVDAANDPTCPSCGAKWIWAAEDVLDDESHQLVPVFCQACGYDLARIGGDTCPECGWVDQGTDDSTVVVDDAVSQDSSPRKRKTRRHRSLLISFSVVVLGAAIFVFGGPIALLLVAIAILLVLLSYLLTVSRKVS